MPYYAYGDIDKTKLEWMKLRESTRKALPLMLNDHSPMIGLCMAPEDMAMYNDFMSATYMKPGFVCIMLVNSVTIYYVAICTYSLNLLSFGIISNTESANDVDSIGFLHLLSLHYAP